MCGVSLRSCHCVWCVTNDLVVTVCGVSLMSLLSLWVGVTEDLSLLWGVSLRSCHCCGVCQ